MCEAPIRIELVSDPMYLCGAREMVSCIAQRVGFDDMSCSKIALAVDEAMCNVIRHGYKRATDRPIWVTVVPRRAEGDTPGRIEIIIEDEADQVDPEAIAGRALDDVRPGGLGVHIMREVMDEVEYARREGARDASAFGQIHGRGRGCGFGAGRGRGPNFACRSGAALRSETDRIGRAAPDTGTRPAGSDAESRRYICADRGARGRRGGRDPVGDVDMSRSPDLRHVIQSR